MELAAFIVFLSFCLAVFFMVNACDHKWEVIDRGILIDDLGRPCGSYLTKECTKCHKLKREES